MRYESADVADLHTVLKSSFKPGSTLLELGCGSGRDAAFMMKQGFKMIASDGAASMVEETLRHHPELSGNVYTIQIPDELSGEPGSLDGIFSIATLMHLSRQDIEDTILKIKSLLISKGRFLFSVPIQRDDTEKNEFDRKKRRFTALTKDGWQDMCKKHGFEERI